MSLQLLAHRWLTVLLNVCCQSVVLALVIGVAVIALRRASASTRGLACAAGIGVLLVLPLSNLLLPAWRMAQPDGDAATFQHVTADFFAAKSAGSRVRGSATPETVQSQINAADASADRPTVAEPIDWPLIIMFFWAIGVAVGAVRLAGSMLLARREVRRCRSIDSGPLWECVRRHAATMKIRRPISLRTSEASRTPMTASAIWPVLLLPASTMDWSAQRIDAVIIHELAHVRRQDWLIHIAAQVMRSLYWFHPLAWFLARRLALESEQACDDAVLRDGAAPVEYAEQLLTMARELCGTHRSIALAMTKPGNAVRRRIAAVLDASRNRRRMSATSAWATVLCIVVLTNLLGACRPARLASSGSSKSDDAVADAKAKLDRFKAQIAAGITPPEVEERCLQNPAYWEYRRALDEAEIELHIESSTTRPGSGADATAIKAKRERVALLQEKLDQLFDELRANAIAIERSELEQQLKTAKTAPAATGAER